MLDIPCPQLERLAAELIDAYRRRDDLICNVGSSPDAIRAGVEVFRIHGMITAHRSQCSICRSRADALQKKKPASVDRGDLGHIPHRMSYLSR